MRSGSTEGDGWQNGLGLTISRASGSFNNAFIVRRYRLITPTASAATTYLLTPWCRVLLEKLTGLKLVKKFPAFHGTRR